MRLVAEWPERCSCVHEQHFLMQITAVASNYMVRVLAQHQQPPCDPGTSSLLPLAPPAVWPTHCDGQHCGQLHQLLCAGLGDKDTGAAGAGPNDLEDGHQGKTALVRPAAGLVLQGWVTRCTHCSWGSVDGSAEHHPPP